MTTTPPRWTDGAAIAAVRRERRLTQYDLADLIGVSQVHVSLIESGRRDPSLGLLSRICDALDVDRGPFLRNEAQATAAAANFPVKAAAA